MSDHAEDYAGYGEILETLTARAEKAESEREAAEAKIESQTTLLRRARMAEEKLQARVAIEREGMVTVYDHKGVYQGCLGTESWAWLLAHPNLGADGLAALVAERDEALASRSEILRNSEIERKALQAERDEARRELDETVEAYHARLREKSAAEARVTELEAALLGLLESETVGPRARPRMESIARAALANEAECSALGNCPQAGCPLCDPQGALGGEDAS